jgi:hypothetical protein
MMAADGSLATPGSIGGMCATNVAFGAADRRGLYITACTHVFRIRTRHSRAERMDLRSPA